jgi:hypothetical protein
MEVFAAMPVLAGIQLSPQGISGFLPSGIDKHEIKKVCDT